jgi:hypothetical protein
MEGFRDTMDYCGFSDLGYKGLPYTWDNRRECAQNVKVRLDRGLADEAWLDLFGESSVTHVQTTESDHCAVLVHITRSDLICFHRINSDRNGLQQENHGSNYKRSGFIPGRKLICS